MPFSSQGRLQLKRKKMKKKGLRTGIETPRGTDSFRFKLGYLEHRGTRNQAHDVQSSLRCTPHDPERLGSVGTESCTPQNTGLSQTIRACQHETDGIVSLGVGGKTLQAGPATVFHRPKSHDAGWSLSERVR